MKKILLIVALAIASFLYGGPTKEQFTKTCDSLGIHHSNVVWAQARLESGNFTSAHFMNRNNCLGIYDSKNKRYASFASWQDCLIAYRDKVQYKCKTTGCTDEEYIKWLIRMGYASDSTYETKVLKIVRSGK